MSKPLAIELFAGLHGWGAGFVAEGFDVVGFDIVDMPKLIGAPREPGCQLVLQDVLTLHGSQFRDAAVIVASPPCQFFSYTGMPWSKAKALAQRVLSDPALLEKELALFRACFRLQREASDAAGRYVPMVVENVCKAQRWVGRAAWHFGSFYLWGDVPALMPARLAGPMKLGVSHRSNGETNFHGSAERAKGPGFRIDGSGGSFQTAAVKEAGQKLPVGHDTFAKDGRKCNKLTDPRYGSEGLKQGGEWWHDNDSITRRTSSRSPARKAASAQIAKIPLTLSRHIARVYHP